MTIDEATRMVAEVPHWHHKFEIYPGVVTPGSYDPRGLFQKLHVPDDLTGLRVLDIGSSDGFFSLQMANRGAKIVAVDYRSKKGHGFDVMERLNRVDIEYHQMNIFDLPNARLGTFDIVLFLGVLYHLPDMMKALHIVRLACHGVMYLETHADTSTEADIAVARYYRGDTLANDYTNFWSPNRLCLIDMLFDVGFDVTRDEPDGDRLFVEAKSADGRRSEKLALGYGLVNPSES